MIAMMKLSGGKIWLGKGEVVPVSCECGHLYQPEFGSQTSFCPQCKRLHDHKNGASYAPVAMKNND